jgi:Transcriptional regulator, AbiEi antitoxin
MTISTVDSRIARLANRQAGTFGRAQALAVGMTDSSIHRRVRSGRWLVLYRGVYVLAGVPPTWHTEIWAALLAAGSMATVTHESSVRLHGSPHVAPHPVTLTVPHGMHPRVSGATVHQIDDLRVSQVTTVDGLPVSRPARAVVEVAATLGRRRLGRVLDDLVFDRRTTYDDVGVALAEVARPGKPGVVALAGVLDDRSDAGGRRRASSSVRCSPRSRVADFPTHNDSACSPGWARLWGSSTPRTPTAASSSRPTAAAGTRGWRTCGETTSATPRQPGPAG